MAATKKPKTAPTTPWPATPETIHTAGDWIWIPLKSEWRDSTGKPEELVRQKFVRHLCENYGYPILERALIMQNYIQNGDVITVAAPTGGITSGEGLIVGNIFGIAAYSAAEGDSVELAITGVFKLPKASAAVLTVGARVAWYNTAKHINAPGAGRFPMGVATEAAGNGITSVAVRLDGIGTAAA